MCFITFEIATILQGTSISHLWKRKRNLPNRPRRTCENSQSSRLPQQRRTPGKLAIDSIPERQVITPLKQVTWTHQTPGEAPTGSLTFPFLRTTDKYGWFGVVFVFPKGHLSCEGSILQEDSGGPQGHYRIWGVKISEGLVGVCCWFPRHRPPTNHWLQIAIRGKKNMIEQKKL